MRTYFKPPELLTLAEGFLKLIRDPKLKDYDHVIPRFDAAIKSVGQIINNGRVLNMLKISVSDLVLKPEADIEQWNNALLAVTNIFTEMNIKPTLYKEGIQILERIRLLIQLKLYLDKYNSGSKVSRLFLEIPTDIISNKRGLIVKYKSRLAHHNK